MRQSNVKSHLCNRNILKRERLGSYISYFLNYEMKMGKISCRFGKMASERIE
jgi:hypothetical protein